MILFLFSFASHGVHTPTGVQISLSPLSTCCRTSFSSSPTNHARCPPCCDSRLCTRTPSPSKGIRYNNRRYETFSHLNDLQGVSVHALTLSLCTVGHSRLGFCSKLEAIGRMIHSCSTRHRCLAPSFDFSDACLAFLTVQCTYPFVSRITIYLQ